MVGLGTSDESRASVESVESGCGVVQGGEIVKGRDDGWCIVAHFRVILRNPPPSPRNRKLHRSCTHQHQSHRCTVPHLWLHVGGAYTWHGT